jgi:hypothetical protein
VDLYQNVGIKPFGGRACSKQQVKICAQWPVSFARLSAWSASSFFSWSGFKNFAASFRKLVCIPWALRSFCNLPIDVSALSALTSLSRCSTIGANSFFCWSHSCNFLLSSAVCNSGPILGEGRKQDAEKQCGNDYRRSENIFRFHFDFFLCCRGDFRVLLGTRSYEIGLSADDAAPYSCYLGSEQA